MGTYAKRFWQSDGHGMNKAERMGGAYYPYSPERLCDSNVTLDASCAKAVANAQQALSGDTSSEKPRRHVPQRKQQSETA